MFTWNKELLNYLNSFAHEPCIEMLVKIFVDSPIFILPIFLAGYWIFYSKILCFSQSKKSEIDVIIEKEKLLSIFYSVVLGIGISLLIQQFIHVDRPEQHLEAGAKLLLDHLPDASFPSDHATVSMAFLNALLLAGYKKWFYVLLVPFVFMNLSRVIAGVHWPLDIIVGSTVGIFSAFFTFRKISQLKLVKTINMQIIKLMDIIKL